MLYSSIDSEYQNNHNLSGEFLLRKMSSDSLFEFIYSILLNILCLILILVLKQLDYPFQFLRGDILEIGLYTF